MGGTLIAIRTVAAAAATAVVLLLAAPAHAADPSSNTSANGLYNCDVNSSQITGACLSGAVSDFNRARAKEGLGPINLPTNFRYLPLSYQLLILANIDRADRGLAPFVGLSATLNAYAMQGARTDTDPPFPSWTMYGAGNWVGSVNAFWAEFEWMYDDGPGSSNLDCPSSGGPGCWGHRHNIIMNWPDAMIMGAATAHGGAATIVLGQDGHDRADQYQWVSAFRYFNNRPRPNVGISFASASPQVLYVNIFRHSRTTLLIQRYYGGAWHTVKTYVTPGAVAGNVTWHGHFNGMTPGTYRVASNENSRFLKQLSNSTIVR
ncbi:hypothetical protein Back2_18810 [Nocardioides baekrokdamisoli]|uniref:SCP domain-containing protein n=1 Tax=Nocardioides baekrokdamisoli TaxID=1804624 RepID=A0A3G9J2B5_9ACTN|nr:hypothetical protein [Nocardioides baekrokdamisoli]BBH17594.1 hypothetical protein Back2_18810 [Nocardioides baekrokdamisoli]